MKKVICSVMLGMVIAGVTAPVPVEASWLSKTWKKLKILLIQRVQLRHHL